MDKEKKQYVIVGVLVVVLIVVGLNSFKKKPARKGSEAAIPVPAAPAALPAAGKSAAGSPAPMAPVRPDEKKIGVQIERASLPWGRDPFMASSEREYQRSDLLLKGISFDNKIGGFAFINNDIVRVGDIVGDYEVVEIEKDRVLLKKGSQSFYLVFPGQE